MDEKPYAGTGIRSKNKWRGEAQKKNKKRFIARQYTGSIAVPVVCE